MQASFLRRTYRSGKDVIAADLYPGFVARAFPSGQAAQPEDQIGEENEENEEK